MRTAHYALRIVPPRMQPESQRLQNGMWQLSTPPHLPPKADPPPAERNCTVNAQRTALCAWRIRVCMSNFVGYNFDWRAGVLRIYLISTVPGSGV